MKKMKKLVAVVLTLAMTMATLTGCGSDPVADEFQKFLNTDMVQVNANYETIKTDVGTIDSLPDDASMAALLKDKVIPKVDESLALLEKIEVNTDEVKAIKGKYKVVLDTYKDSFETMLTALESGDEAMMNEGIGKIDDALAALDEYNAALESLAKEKNLKVEY